ncbi:MAG: DNA-processing protein DprA [Candidatus Gastranaerophilaceae bacterium]
MTDIERIKMLNDSNKNESQGSIMVPIDDLDSVSDDSPNAVDELAMELATIQQSSKRIAVIGSRNLAITHQQIIETLVTALASSGNTIITSGGSSGTNAAAIRGAMKANPDKLKVILPQTIGQQPSDVQDQLIGVPNIVEHPDRAMMTLADASRVCNREIIDDCNQLICFLSHTSKTLHNAIEYAEEGHKVITALYLD